jgi:hypothetical protein
MSHIFFNDNLDIGLFLDVLSVETLSSIQGGLSDMSNDSSPELQDKSHQLLKQITIKLSTIP